MIDLPSSYRFYFGGSFPECGWKMSKRDFDNIITQNSLKNVSSQSKYVHKTCPKIAAFRDVEMFSYLTSFTVIDPLLTLLTPQPSHYVRLTAIYTPRCMPHALWTALFATHPSGRTVRLGTSGRTL